MPLPSAPTRRPNNANRRQADRKANASLLLTGVLCAFLGLGVLALPWFITSPGMQGMVATAAPLGWGLLALGWVLIGWYVWRQVDSR